MMVVGVQTLDSALGLALSQAVEIMETVLVCNMCRAETRLDGYVTQELAVMTFCDAHTVHSEGYGFSILLPLAQFGGILAIAALPAGASPMRMLADGTVPTIHAALGDMSSLCGQMARGALLRVNGTLWGDVRFEDRCPACAALT
jgi:hypothetical protein